MKCKHERLAKDVCYGALIVVCLDCNADAEVQNDDFMNPDKLRRMLNGEPEPETYQQWQRRTSTLACEGGFV